MFINLLMKYLLWRKKEHLLITFFKLLSTNLLAKKTFYNSNFSNFLRNDRENETDASLSEEVFLITLWCNILSRVRSQTKFLSFVSFL